MAEAVRIRIQELITIKAADLMDNEGNWRLHPSIQRQALEDAVEQFGITDVLKVYYSEKHGGLTLIDGHLRKDAYPEVEWPALLLDVTDEEADLILASGDAIASLAEASAAKLVELRNRVKPGGSALSAVLDGLAQKASAALQRMEQLKASPILNNPNSVAAKRLREQIAKPVTIAPSAVASAPEDEEQAIANLLDSQQIPQRPDFSGVVEQFQDAERGKVKGNEKWYYIEYYGDQEKWDAMEALLEEHKVGQSHHEVDPDFFYQAVHAFLSK